MLQGHRYGASVSRGVPVYSPAFAGTKLYCLVTEAHRCEKLAHSFYAVVPGRDSNPRPLDRDFMLLRHCYFDAVKKSMLLVFWHWQRLVQSCKILSSTYSPCRNWPILQRDLFAIAEQLVSSAGQRFRSVIYLCLSSIRNTVYTVTKKLHHFILQELCQTKLYFGNLRSACTPINL